MCFIFVLLLIYCLFTHILILFGRYVFIMYLAIIFLEPKWALSQWAMRPKAEWAIDSEAMREKGIIVLVKSN